LHCEQLKLHIISNEETRRLLIFFFILWQIPLSQFLWSGKFLFSCSRNEIISLPLISVDKRRAILGPSGVFMLNTPHKLAGAAEKHVQHPSSLTSFYDIAPPRCWLPPLPTTIITHSQ
jgi:hypothetical protein